MKTYENCTKFTPARGIVTAVLIAAFVAGFSVESAAQQCATVAATNVVAWIQQDTTGGPRYVCYRAATGPTNAGQLTAAAPTGPTAPKPAPLCVYTQYGWVC